MLAILHFGQAGIPGQLEEGLVDEGGRLQRVTIALLVRVPGSDGPHLPYEQLEDVCLGLGPARPELAQDVRQFRCAVGRVVPGARG